MMRHYRIESFFPLNRIYKLKLEVFLARYTKLAFYKRA